ncbi:MAG TPA: hypothetical protein DCW60_01260 [Sutterella sp.]|nr:hypothetical protein [Sutterella sp.]
MRKSEFFSPVRLKTLGLTSPNAMQIETVKALDAADLFLLASPTGSGKTLAYLASALDGLRSDAPNPQVLVLCPTHELALQVARVASDLLTDSPFSAYPIYGQMAPSAFKATLETPPALLVATPGKLLEAARRKKGFLRAVTRLVVDEAERLFDMGFEEDLCRVLGLITPQKTWLISATVSCDLKRFIAKNFPEKPYLIGQSKAKNERVKEIFLLTEPFAWHERVRDIVVDYGLSRVLVFVKTKPEAEHLGKELKLDGFAVGVISSQKTQKQREDALSAFTEGKNQILVATDVLARGIDVENIEAVINTSLPKDTNDYIHRIGRTARYDKTGLAVTFIRANDFKAFENLRKSLKTNTKVMKNLPRTL